MRADDGFPSSDMARPRDTRERPRGSTVVGLRIRYADGTVLDIEPGVKAWDAVPSRGVLFVSAFYSATYVSDGVEYRYRTALHSQDYYWWYRGEYGSGPAPRGASVKHGAALPDAEWRALYDEAIEDRTWP